MTVFSKPVRFRHRVIVIKPIPLGDGRIVPINAEGWLIGYSHIWNEPDVKFDGYGVCGIEKEYIKAVRVKGRLQRER